MTTALIVGAGPAGLMAADVLSAAGVAVTIAEQMPSPARKFLMAGKSGLNITRAGRDTDAPFAAGYGEMPAAFAHAIAAFGPAEVIDWAQELGQEVFTGSTGRVFPRTMKASPLLRAWLLRLGTQGVTLNRRWTWTGWGEAGAQFDTPDGAREIAADITVLAMGGASWRRLGSDGLWAARVMEQGFGAEILAPFAASNVGLRVDWSAHMARWFGAPVKGVSLRVGDDVSRGECVVSARGLEGGGIYALTPALRGGAALTVDLLPDMDAATVAARIATQNSKASLATQMRKALKLDGVRAALAQECARPLVRETLPQVMKALPLTHAGLRPMDEAISTAGGLRFAALDGFALRGGPDRSQGARIYAAGEMLDWEAPTGGWLITACLATGLAAARQALAEAG